MTKNKRLEEAIKGYTRHLKRVADITAEQGLKKSLTPGKLKFIKRQIMLTKKALGNS